MKAELWEDSTGVLLTPTDVLTTSCWDSPSALLSSWSQPEGVQGTCDLNSVGFGVCVTSPWPH